MKSTWMWSILKCQKNGNVCENPKFTIMMKMAMAKLYIYEEDFKVCIYFRI